MLKKPCEILLAVCLALALTAPPALAENIVYEGGLDMLKTVDGVDYSLAPSGSAGASGASKSDSLTYNNVIVNSGTITGNVYGAVNTKDTYAVTNNKVFINGGTVEGKIYGGYGGGDAIGNSVIINGGKVVDGPITGGSASGNAIGNNVIINDGEVERASITGGYSDNGNATGNSVTINGGTFDFTDDQSIAGGKTNQGDAIYNTVTISGAPTGLDKARVAGGVPLSPLSSTDFFTGNTLNFRTSNLTLDALKNFEYLNFYGPAGLKAGDTMLTVATAVNNDPASGTADLTEYNGNGRSSVVAFDVDGFATPLQAGDTVTLIDARPAVTTGGSGLITNNLNRTAEGLHGVTLKYNFDIDAQNNQLLVARVTGVEVNKQAKALSEGYLAGLALVNRGADVAVGHGLSRRGNGVFAVIDGDSSRYNTGSHVDADSFSLLAGISGGTPVSAAGTLTLTGFVGYGRGGYGTYNSFANAASVTGGGDSEYVGAGVLARLDIAGADEGHPYAEAHFQGGIVKTDFSSGNLTNGTGQGASYDSSSRYYSAHIGAGYIRNFAGDKELDLYAKYFFARCGGDSVRLNTGDDVSFDAVNSSRLRVGGRYVWKAGNVRYYAGLAWEYEFDGEANATVYGFMPLDAPDMVGGTGILELGLSFTPSETRPLVIDLGVKGYAGKREGISGNIRFEYML